MRGAVRNIQEANTALDLFTYEKPTIVVLGQKKLSAKLKKTEDKFNLSFLFANKENVKNLISSRTIGIIIDQDSKLAGDQIELLSFISEYRLLPIFYLSRKEKKSQFYQSLYEQGLHGVIDFPHEFSLLQELIVESLKPKSLVQGTSAGEKNLAKMIKTHLVLLGKYKSIGVKVIDGFVFLDGKINTLFEKQDIVEEVFDVLGVRKVVDKDLIVKNFKSITDSELERKIKLYMSRILDESKRSTSVQVKDKVVTLLGTVENELELKQVEKFAAKQKGVKSIKTKIERCPEVVSERAKKAKWIEKRIRELFQGARHIKVKIYGHYAEVTGTVKINSSRKLIEKYLLQALPVKKVVNKLVFP